MPGKERAETLSNFSWLCEMSDPPQDRSVWDRNVTSVILMADVGVNTDLEEWYNDVCL